MGVFEIKILQCEKRKSNSNCFSAMNLELGDNVNIFLLIAQPLI